VPIDTAAKRRSVATVAGMPRPVGQTPDAAKGQAWRQAAGWGYLGILAWSGLVPPVIIGRVTMVFERGGDRAEGYMPLVTLQASTIQSQVILPDET